MGKGEDNNPLASGKQQISAKNITPQTLEFPVWGVGSRGNGKVDSPVLETLLMYHPKHQRGPSAEFSDGYKKEYVSDGTGKSHGIRLQDCIPCELEGRAGKLGDERGGGW